MSQTRGIDREWPVTCFHDNSSCMCTGYMEGQSTFADRTLNTCTIPEAILDECATEEAFLKEKLQIFP